jgi:N-acetylglutamate synthase-like GNAT family acetyltransferase
MASDGFRRYRQGETKTRKKLLEQIDAQKFEGDFDTGLDNIQSAVKDHYDILLILWKDYDIIGGASFHRNEDYIELDHLGVVQNEQRKNYGTTLINKIKELYNRPISVITNGFSNEFYEKIGFKRMNNGKLPAWYRSG